MCCTLQDLFIRKTDFNGSPNVYQNKALGGRFRILLDRHIVLERGLEWELVPNGGFIITIPGWQVENETVLVIQFY